MSETHKETITRIREERQLLREDASIKVLAADERMSVEEAVDRVMAQGIDATLEARNTRVLHQDRTPVNAPEFLVEAFSGKTITNSSYHETLEDAKAEVLLWLEDGADGVHLWQTPSAFDQDDLEALSLELSGPST